MDTKASENVDLGDDKTGTKCTEGIHRESKTRRYSGQPNSGSKGANPKPNVSGFPVTPLSPCLHLKVKVRLTNNVLKDLQIIMQQ